MEEWQLVAACGRMVASGDKEAGIVQLVQQKFQKGPEKDVCFVFLLALQLPDTVA